MADDPTPPDRLWKYREWGDDGHTRDMIIHGEIYFAPKESLNDSFEFRWHDKYPEDPAEHAPLAKGLLEARFPRMTRKQRKELIPDMVAEIERYAAKGGGVSPTVTVVEIGLFSASAINDNILCRLSICYASIASR